MADDTGSSFYPPDEVAGGLPINLDSLRDGPPGTKPFYPYSTLIRYAIKGSPNQRLLLEDIYYAIESRFPYFRTAPNGWKNSVRHNLSLNPCFQKEARPLTDRGKGSYWIVNDEVDPRTGVHRVRKKKGKASAPPPEYVQPVASGSAGPLPEEEVNPEQYPPFTGFVSPMAAAMMSFGIPPPLSLMTPEDRVDATENGDVDWRALWLKEIEHLQEITAQQDKLGAQQQWYQMMLFRVRSVLLAPLAPPEGELYMQPPPEEEEGEPQGEPVIEEQ
ncbi:Forkhead box protein c2 [Mycena indigotica]|uniref:Forkhead box protein c2 n=1 Tax=Mycena indigotica TaxID=2126181 RepID=A0A8H6SNJ2_9AGAR|nr:Forkhead box protein c2 [Mycena indigotica]KAF7301512.1 Forkhead box protein c2 [Mycena indigotica]